MNEQLKAILYDITHVLSVLSSHIPDQEQKYTYDRIDKIDELIESIPSVWQSSLEAKKGN